MNSSIKYWSESDRPREKLLNKGKEQLSDAELLAILLGSGSKNESALALARRMLSQYNNSISELQKAGISELTQFRGIGKVKAITIISALELASRAEESSSPMVQIGNSRNAFEAIRQQLRDLKHEEFWVIFLNRANRIIAKICISKGGITATVVDPKILFKKALEHFACGIILAHNHPSGNLKPSQSDIKLTHKLKNAAQSLDIKILDHLIIAGSGYYSFADEGVL
ncbi:MAG: DNA repair protein RadC [Bacteroidota bacterium]